MKDSTSEKPQQTAEAQSRDARRSVRGDKATLSFACCLRGRRSDSAATGDDLLREYARQFAALVNARLCDVQVSSRKLVTAGLDALDRENYDLLILDVAPPASLIRNTKERALPSLLISRQIAWPIHRILLLMRGEATDGATVEWAVRLAQSADSHVTLLVVLPPAARQSDGVDDQLADVLARHTVPGRYVRQVLKRLVSNDIEAVLRLRQGELARQVRQELMDANYDLVITSAEPPGRLLNRYLERLIEPLLQWTPAPVLVARVPAQWSEQASEDGHGTKGRNE